MEEMRGMISVLYQLVSLYYVSSSLFEKVDEAQAAV